MIAEIESKYSNSTEPILNVKDLRVFYRTETGNPLRAVDGVSFQVFKSEILGIVGESGCGKSTLSTGIINLVDPPGYIQSGEVIFRGENILELDEEGLRQLYLSRLIYIPQSGMNALNPVMKIKDQIVDGIRSHQEELKKQAAQKATELLKLVGLPPEAANMYPHELSGGMKQRSTISIALALKPELIIADEPTTALDVVVQRAVLEFLVGFKEKFGSSIIIITHDIAVQAQVCDRLAVMYAGKIVEIGEIKEIFRNPMHPYTKALIDATPSLLDKKELVGLTGRPPSLINVPIGCRFASRCPCSMNICTEKEPNLLRFDSGHKVACHLHQ